LTALRTAQQSTFQTTALQLASEMAEKMRINDRQMKLADNANLFLSVDYQSATDAEITSPGALCYEANCTAEDLAKFDIYELKTRIKALPGGRVRICRDANPWDSATGAFKWSCTALEKNANNVPLVIKIGWEGKGNNPDGRAIKETAKQFPPSVAITLES
jgi:type IV pilus assembly protein PilV